MFNDEKLLKKLKKMDKYPEGKQKKIIRKFLEDEEFYEYFFKARGFNVRHIKDRSLTSLMQALATPIVLKNLCKLIKSEDVSINRNNIVIIYSICNYSIDINEDRVDVLKEVAPNDKSYNKSINKYTILVTKVIDALRDSIKEKTKNISKKCGLNRQICLQIICKVPDKSYIKSHEVGMHVSNILRIIYNDLSESGDFDKEDIRWRPLFKFLFGNEQLPNVATIILLEGVDRIEKYLESSGIDAVKACWDSLTEFALHELEKTDDNTRSQMMELYMKRLNKMPSKSTRIDMMNLPNQFVKLSETITKYAGKLTKILSD